MVHMQARFESDCLRGRREFNLFQFEHFNFDIHSNPFYTFIYLIKLQFLFRLKTVLSHRVRLADACSCDQLNLEQSVKTKIYISAILKKTNALKSQWIRLVDCVIFPRSGRAVVLNHTDSENVFSSFSFAFFYSVGLWPQQRGIMIQMWLFTEIYL